MHIKKIITFSLLFSLSLPVYAAESGTASHVGHGNNLYHAFTLESQFGAGKGGPVASWELDGWVGGDYNKLWLKSNGERLDGKTEDLEFWALYSRNIADFWDFQAGIRHDTRPQSTSYAVLGFEGLAPYFFKTGVHLFLSDEGDVSVRLNQENEVLINQRLILKPYLEANFYAQDVPEKDVGAGLADAELGLQMRYEVTRKFAPYVDVHYGRKFGETSSIAKSHGDDNDGFVASLGLRLMF